MSDITIYELPNEILLHVFSYLDVDSLSNSALVCQRWTVLINHSEILWKELCTSLNETRRTIKIDRELGKSWQESFKMNYGTNEFIKKWKMGRYSTPSHYNALPPKPMREMDCESWGEIFQMELDRT